MLILEGLGRAVGTDVWDRAGEIERGPPTTCGRRSEPLRGRAGRKWCSERMPHRSTHSYSMSIYIYGLAFECFSNALTRIVDSECWGCDLRGERIEAEWSGRKASQKPHPRCADRSPRDARRGCATRQKGNNTHGQPSWAGIISPRADS